MKKYGFAAWAIMGLYALNRFVLLPRADGHLHRLLSGYFADFLAGGMMIVLLFAALHLAHRKPPRLWHCLTLALACGLFWECVTPLYLPRSVADPWDILAAVLGGGCILPILYRMEE
jgi:peptidoglycan/LPS O-acetylase OafA/YrhL